jgi:cell wall-associated NlpC family hydrolase
MTQRYYPPPPAADPAQAQALTIARHLVGTPYHYGGDDPASGFDCSGLVYYSHKVAGLPVPRTTRQQFAATYPVGRDALAPGDLVFFRIGRRGKIAHVGIYVGDDEFVHSPSTGKRVQVSDLTNPYWAKRFIRGGRIPAPSNRPAALSRL